MLTDSLLKVVSVISPVCIFDFRDVGAIVAKKRDPGILDPELFLAQIRKVEARLGKLAKIRKSVIN